MSTELRIVFDGPPGPETGRFVEVEDSAGKSLNAGEWHKRDDGLWELRLTAMSRPAPEGGEVEKMRRALGDLHTAAKLVSLYGATTGPQWVNLTAAMVRAHKALGEPRHE